MFNANLNGMHHQEQIKDYLREAEQGQPDDAPVKAKGKKTAIGAAVAAAGLALLIGLANSSQFLAMVGLVR